MHSIILSPHFIPLCLVITLFFSSMSKEKLTAAFQALTPSDITKPDNKVDPDTPELRDGTSHFRVSPVTAVDSSPVAFPTPATQTHKLNSGSSSAGAVAPLKVLPYKHDVTKFNALDSTYSALDFIELCEDAFLSTQVKDAKEKIGFIWQQLVDGSLPSEMMCSSTFKHP